MVKVFFDASVIFSALYSKKGASYKLTQLVKSGYITGVTTQTVIEEVKRNIEKFRERRVDVDVDVFIAEHKFFVREKVKKSETFPFKRIVVEKDAHVLAGAISTECDFLVTLDKKHIDRKEVKEKVKRIIVVSPKKLLFTLLE